MSHTTKAIIFNPPNRVTLEVVELPEPNQDELLLQTKVSLTSPGTELRALAGWCAQVWRIYPWLRRRRHKQHGRAVLLGGQPTRQPCAVVGRTHRASRGAALEPDYHSRRGH
jgi:hypothetical protein